MAASILNSVKKILGIVEDDTTFDLDVMVHINSTFATLNQLGIGPEDGFEIEDDEATWDAFLGGNKKLNNVKTYVYLCVRNLFDPPPTGYLVEAFENQKAQLEWRMNVVREEYAWMEPDPDPIQEEDGVIDGGQP